MFNPFSALTANRTDTQARQAIQDLCQTLRTPGVAIPPDADKDLAKALLSREQGSAEITIAALTLLNSNRRVVSILELALQQNEPALDALLADGTLITFLNAPLIQALLYSSPVPSLAFERLLLHIRKRLLGCAIDSAWQSDTSTTSAAAALAAYAFLTEYIGDELAEETELVSQLVHRLDTIEEALIDPFDVAVLTCYRRLESLDAVDKVARILEGLDDPAFQAVLRCQVFEPKREAVLLREVQSLSNISDKTSTAVRALYEDNPYPRWVCYHRNEPQTPHQILQRACRGVDLEAFGEVGAPEILIAGCGTGLAAVDDAVLWKDSKVLAVDLSLNSIAYGRRSTEEVQLTSIEFAQADILQLACLDRSFDYVSCTGVLHHMRDPIAGWKALTDLCRPGGVMRIGLYNAAARHAVIAGRQYLKDVSGGDSPEEVRRARQALISHAFRSGKLDETFAGIFDTFDFYNLSMCRDLLLHVHEVDFTIPKIQTALDQLGLRFCGFVDPRGSLTDAYVRFAPNDQLGLDLGSWAKFEQQDPNAFSNMYDFMVQKPAG